MKEKDLENLTKNLSSEISYKIEEFLSDKKTTETEDLAIILLSLLLNISIYIASSGLSKEKIQSLNEYIKSVIDDQKNTLDTLKISKLIN